VNASGPFDVPAEFAEEGDYPGGAFTEVNGFRGTSTFTFGFTNTTYVSPPTSPTSPLPCPGQRHYATPGHYALAWQYALGMALKCLHFAEASGGSSLALHVTSKESPLALSSH